VKQLSITVLAVLALLLLIAPVSAQKPGSSGKETAKPVGTTFDEQVTSTPIETLTKKLDLNATQVTQVQALIKKRQADRKNVVESANKRIRNVFTTKQTELWDKKKATIFKEYFQKNAQDFTDLLKDFDLTGDQKKQIQTIVADEREKGKKSRESFKDELQKVLTADQYDVLTGKKKAMPAKTPAKTPDKSQDKTGAKDGPKD
jgi:Spy/CpxP family protein refolding chaperone